MIYLPKTDEFTVIKKMSSGSLFIFNGVLVAYLISPNGLQRRYSIEVFTKNLGSHNNLYLLNQFLKQFNWEIHRLIDNTYIYYDMETGHTIKMDNVLFETILY